MRMRTRYEKIKPKNKGSLLAELEKVLAGQGATIGE